MKNKKILAKIFSIYEHRNFIFMDAQSILRFVRKKERNALY